MADNQTMTIQQGYEFALKLIMDDRTYSDTQKKLIEKGFDKEIANKITETIRQQVLSAKKKNGRRNMLIGGTIFIIGLLVTFFTYKAAIENGGGKYIIAWGAVVFGGIQFGKGLLQAFDI